ncbi:MAG TPA: phosphatase PAP2 family protein [Anaerolineae bacterium]|nr:phosphatase PAP2 family protein [Anaerolineae bacterium]
MSKLLAMNALERMLALDHALSARLAIRRASLLRRAAQVVAHSGDSLVWIAVGIGLWALNQPRWAARVEITVFALMGMVAALKFAFRRRRPTGQRGRLYLELDAHSFPSGHAARAAGLAVTFGAIEPALGVGLGVWAALVCLSRVALGIHYVSDVAGGAIVGIGVGLILAILM